MPKAEWGVKRTCPNCEARFYDLQREPILCPECGTTFNIDGHGKVSGMRERRVPVAADAEEEALVDDEDLVDEAEDDPLLGEEDEDEEPAAPALSDEDEDEEVAFTDESLIDEDEDEEDDVEDEDDDLDDLDDVPGKEKGA